MSFWKIVGAVFVGAWLFAFTAVFFFGALGFVFFGFLVELLSGV